MTRVYVPIDSSALSLGAERVARALQQEAAQRGTTIEMVRNGSRGMFWLEPLVEVETPAGRVAFGPVRPQDVAALFDAGFLTQGTACQHPLCLGLTEELSAATMRSTS